ncbi:NAD-dependent succinate-semialdehyde dehydrogenase [Bradyrhizobium erythrophlei]|uniref:Succinate-semialdehyde dehydrogenase / glutarate-semialdehyde dehydrogenase n=1 Tax=Bradyrhizobium erythrophlei TaxID=1437360 RepID=A0A1M5SSE2_9BRAD|nr:NAD-dependent succinate-semialdehyde dehydrogenase [Bradyrhizobium erythrophlei]SHH41426.1 succinate-semialdehyde dehydrogenase / glutarate-semialdehyde dehydrogenase [Bradyrhizobium erythrophlei]
MTYQTVSPANGEVIKTFPDISDADLEIAVRRAQATYEQDWRHRSVVERARIVSAVAGRLRDSAEEFARYATLEMGKLLVEARGEIALSADILDYYAKHGDRYLKPQAVPDAPGNAIETLPLGIILGIEPWNFPYYQLARVAGPQLVVGNVVMIKHAGSVPQSATAFARLFDEVGAPAGVYTNLFANFDQVGRLIDDVRIRGVTVTGSERAGASVAERAGRNLKKSVMELGGSDPFIVLEDAPLEPTLDNALWGRMNNTGQSCVAAKRFIVVGKQRGKEFLEGLKVRMSALKVGDPNDPCTKLGPVSSEKALKGLLHQIDLAKKNGAKVVIGGNRIARPGFYIEATILTDITKDNPIYSQELFGPVASVYVVKTEDEAIELANATPFGLGGSVFTADIEQGKKVAARVESGMVFVNHSTWTAPELPFGGIKNSGYGRELSELGFGEFVNRRLVSVSPVGAPPPGVNQGG